MTTRAYLAGIQTSFLQDEAGVLTTGDLDAALTAALALYSVRAPRRVIEEYSGDGITTVLALPAAWDTDFSRILRSYTVQGNAQPRELDRAELWIEDTATGLKVRLLAAIALGTTLRLVYEGRHTATATSTTVPSGEQTAVGMLAAALAADLLAIHYAAQGETALTADVVDHRTRESLYGMRGKRYMELYEQAVPLRRHTHALAVTR